MPSVPPVPAVFRRTVPVAAAVAALGVGVGCATTTDPIGVPRSAVLPGLVAGGVGFDAGAEATRLDRAYAGGSGSAISSERIEVERRSIDRQRTIRGRIHDWSWTEIRVRERRTR